MPKISKIKYLSNNHYVTAYTIIPDEDSKYPCIIFNRGGSKEFGQLDENIVSNLLAFYSSQGYVVVASQYSGNDGSEGIDEFGGADLDDILNLKNVLEEIPQADTSNIFMVGTSRGGMMTYLALTKVNWIKAAVSVSGSANVSRSYQLRPELKDFRSDMYDVDNEIENQKRSAVYWASKFNSNTPILLLHGTADEQVTVLDTLELAIELHKYQKPFALRIFEGGNHGLGNFKVERNTAILNWFKKHISLSS